MQDKTMPMTDDLLAAGEAFLDARKPQPEPRRGTDAGRDPARIERITSNLLRVWQENPGRRLNSIIEQALHGKPCFANAEDEIIDEHLAAEVAKLDAAS